MDWTGSDTVILSASSWGKYIDIHRGETPWIKVASIGAFSVNGKDYTITFTVPSFLKPVWVLAHAGETIVEVRRRGFMSRSFDFRLHGKSWALEPAWFAFGGLWVVVNPGDADALKPEWFSFGSKWAECGWQAAGALKQRKGFYWGQKLDAQLPKELPDEVQVMLIWFWFTLNPGGGD